MNTGAMVNVFPYRLSSSMKRKCKYFMSLFVICAILTQLFAGAYVHGLIKQFKRDFFGFHDVTAWMTDNVTGCDGHFTAYGHQFAVLRNVVLIPGDTVFYIPCSDVSPLHQYKFDFGKEGTHLNKWLKNIRSYNNNKFSDTSLIVEKKFTVLVLRYEYANMYHTLTDWYNVFLVSKLLNVSISDVGVILYDKHARSHLDEAWRNLFGDVIEVGNLTKPTMFKQLAWNIIGYESPINHHGLRSLPFMQEFHSFFISQHGVPHTKSLNCDKVSISFLWRRDYVAHPNNPTGLISRKIKNEDELVNFLRKQYPTANVDGSQLDNLSFHQQVKIITSTDILISMHGAGLSHILFLPSHGGVIELFPTYWHRFGMTHFKSMARWRGLKYVSWQNYNPSTEYDKFYSYISPAKLFLYVDQIYRDICPE